MLVFWAVVVVVLPMEFMIFVKDPWFNWRYSFIDDGLPCPVISTISSPVQVLDNSSGTAATRLGWFRISTRLTSSPIIVYQKYYMVNTFFIICLNSLTRPLISSVLFATTHLLLDSLLPCTVLENTGLYLIFPVRSLFVAISNGIPYSILFSASYG